MDAKLNHLKPTVYIESVPELARDRAESAAVEPAEEPALGVEAERLTGWVDGVKETV